jgi:serine/threonine-protein kinase HipA
MSGQPAFDAGQVRHNRFKLAMAVGANRHYVVERIQPRHFIQSADACGLAAGTIERIFTELIDNAPAAIERVRAALPNDFPHELAECISHGFARRLDILVQHVRGQA